MACAQKGEKPSPKRGLSDQSVTHRETALGEPKRESQTKKGARRGKKGHSRHGMFAVSLSPVSHHTNKKKATRIGLFSIPFGTQLMTRHQFIQFPRNIESYSKLVSSKISYLSNLSVLCLMIFERFPGMDSTLFNWDKALWRDNKVSSPM